MEAELQTYTTEQPLTLSWWISTMIMSSTKTATASVDQNTTKCLMSKTLTNVMISWPTSRRTCLSKIRPRFSVCMKMQKSRLPSTSPTSSYKQPWPSSLESPLQVASQVTRSWMTQLQVSSQSYQTCLIPRTLPRSIRCLLKSQWTLFSNKKFCALIGS